MSRQWCCTIALFFSLRSSATVATPLHQLPLGGFLSTVLHERHTEHHVKLHAEHHGHRRKNTTEHHVKLHVKLPAHIEETSISVQPKISPVPDVAVVHHERHDHGRSSTDQVARSQSHAPAAHAHGRDSTDQAARSQSHAPAAHSEAHSHSHSGGDHGQAHHAAGGGMDGLGYSLCLIGAVAFNMSLLYLVNHKDPGILLATWQVLSMTLSIFSAVLAYATIRGIFVEPFVAHGTYSTVFASFALFIAVYVLNEAALYCLKAPQYVNALHCGAAIGCHLLGFAGCYAFADIQQAAPFGATILGDVLVVFLAVVVLCGLAWVARFVHMCIERLHSAPRAHLEDIRWEREVELMENEAMAMCVGYLIVQAVAFAIRGSHASTRANLAPTDVTQVQSSAILACAAFFGFATVAGVYVVTWTMKRRGLTQVDTLNFESYATDHVVPFDLRLLMILQNSLGVAMAWCLLLWAEWQLYTSGFHGPRSAACMLVGLGLTLLGFAAVFVLESLSHSMHMSGTVDPEKVVRSLTLTLGIVIGFAWERSFHVGLHDIAHALTGLSSFSELSGGLVTEVALTHLLAVVLILIVTPAWGLYVFPMVEVAKLEGFSKYYGAASPSFELWNERRMSSAERLSTKHHDELILTISRGITLEEQEGDVI